MTGAGSGINTDGGEQATGGIGGSCIEGELWRTVDITDCCLGRIIVNERSVDRATHAAAFDPTMPNGEYRYASGGRGLEGVLSVLNRTNLTFN